MGRHCHPKCEMFHPDVYLEHSRDQLNPQIMDFWPKLLHHEPLMAIYNKLFVHLFEQILLNQKELQTSTRKKPMKKQNLVINSRLS